jgi:hypothetical protein
MNIDFRLLRQKGLRRLPVLLVTDLVSIFVIVVLADIFSGVSLKHTSRFLWVTTGLNCLTGICNGQLLLRLNFSLMNLLVDVISGVSSKHGLLWVATGLTCLAGIRNGSLVLRLTFSLFIVPAEDRVLSPASLLLRRGLLHFPSMELELLVSFFASRRGGMLDHRFLFELLEESP